LARAFPTNALGIRSLAPANGDQNNENVDSETYRLIFAAIIIGGTTLPSSAAAQVRYQATVFPDLVGQVQQHSVATALNNHGAAVGISEDDAQSQSAIGWAIGRVGALVSGSDSAARCRRCPDDFDFSGARNVDSVDARLTLTL
jgi:hypothetical protein